MTFSHISLKLRIITVLLIGFCSSILLYGNCTKRTFSITKEAIQQRLSEGSTIFINNDDQYTNSQEVTLFIQNNSAVEMYITNIAGCQQGGVWEDYSITKPWILNNKNRETSVYIKFREQEGGVESSCTLDSIVHDDIPPRLMLVTPAVKMTKNPTTNIRFSAVDDLSGIGQLMCFDTAGVKMPSCTEQLVITNSNQGSNLVTITATDKAGNTSQPLIDTWIFDTTAPILTVNEVPPSITNQSLSVFRFTGRDNISTNITYECRMNGAAFASCSSPHTLNLPEGVQVVEIRALDEAGNSSIIYNYSWTIDKRAPTVRITSAPNSVSNSVNASFSFQAADPTKPIVRYECQLDNGSYATCSSPRAYNGLAAGARVFSVRGYDAAGNVSAPAVYNWMIDTTVPTVVITSSPAKETSSASGVFLFTATDLDSGIQYSECRVDGNAFQRCNNQYAFTDLPQGNHTFQVRAVDMAGNTSTTASYSWFIDQTAPVLRFTRTPSDPTIVPNAHFIVSGTDNSPSPITYECRLNNEQQYSACTPDTQFNPGSEGIHTFSVRGKDVSGNISVPIVHRWLLDFSGPAINFTDIPKIKSGILDNIKVGFIVTDAYSPIVEVRCGINSTVKDCATVFSESFTTLGEGNYTYTVSARDSLGNTSTKTLSWDITNNVVRMNQSVTVNSNNKADIIIAIDNSGSMNPEQSNMAQRFSTFIDKLDGLDWRIAITTTDMQRTPDKRDGQFLMFITNPNPRQGVYFIDSTMPKATAKSLFATTIQRPASEGSGNEQGIGASYRAIQRSQDPATVTSSAPNRSFFRTDAALSILVVTDADETNASGTLAYNIPENLLSFIKTLWPSKPFIFNSIVVRSGDTACLGQSGNEGYGTMYERLSNLTGGVIGTVCATDYGAQLAAMGQTIVDLVRVINLNCQPVDYNKNGNVLDDVMINLQSGAVMPLSSVAGQSVTAQSQLPVGMHTVNYWCLQ